ncbi:MAG: DNA-3-methyladenine glycosylase I [Gammaproteobacteria bacterium]|nr:DNA-3-methyladenine glycosylase I [Gammaproteobacteria bacterium]NVK87013.1 DNA-3-methyladenine glycosylase I [Gammaproteobacteria bacterium]
MESFKTIFERAADRKGGAQALQQRLSQPLSAERLQAIGDDRFLAEMSKKVFQSGFVWRVVEAKWPDFEEVFFNFDPTKLLLMSPEMLERKATDKRIIRNLTKVKSIQSNALFVQDIAHEFNGFGHWLNSFGTHQTIDLWQQLKQRGTRLGGNTGPYFLRAVGKDTFLLSRDVEAYFRSRDLISGGLTSKRSLQQIQQQFNDWHDQSGLSLQEISQVVAFSIGDNHR